MISVSKSLVNYIPGIKVGEFLFVNQDSEELDGRNTRMSIVKLDLILLGELRPIIGMILLVATNDVTKRGCTEEILLLQTQFLSALS